MDADQSDWRRDKRAVSSAWELVVSFGVDSACFRYVKISNGIKQRVPSSLPSRSSTYKSEVDLF